MVKVRSGPAAVTGDESSIQPLPNMKVRREGIASKLIRKPEDDLCVLDPREKGEGMQDVFFFAFFPSVPPTNRVYIILHGDGVHFSKIQIVEYEYNSGAASDSYVVQYENF